jgi:hypothetical protein
VGTWWRLWSHNTSGSTFIPFVIGVGMLFVNGGPRLGWLLTAGSLIALLAAKDLANAPQRIAIPSLWAPKVATYEAHNARARWLFRERIWGARDTDEETP